jgi:hypothetical protein
MHIKITDGQPQPYSLGQLRRDNTQVSFPTTIPDATLAEYGVFPVTPTEQPAYDPMTQSLADGTPTLVDGVWTQTWTITDRTAEEIAQIEADQWSNVRSERNRLLSDCDWTQLSDAPVDAAAWASYRQSLRDITEQADPFSITWPTPPDLV